MDIASSSVVEALGPFTTLVQSQRHSSTYKQICVNNGPSCDISDALLKLQHPHGGFLPGISMWSPTRQEGDTKIIGPAYTVKFVRSHITNAPKPANHYVRFPLPAYNRVLTLFLD